MRDLGNHPRFENAIVLIDEAYEHGMMPKRPNSTVVPRHIERVAKHRHFGMDIIGVCQSPDTQCDPFLRDLIERHIHVRRRFGTEHVGPTRQAIRRRGHTGRSNCRANFRIPYCPLDTADRIAAVDGSGIRWRPHDAE